MDDLINRWGITDKSRNKQYILITYTEERVQLYIEGHSEGVDLTSGQFVLRILPETKH